MKHHPHAPTQRQIKNLLRKHLFGRNIFCPVCHSYEVIRYRERYRCRRCRIRFSLLSHTWLTHCRVPLPTLWLTLWCFVHQVPVKQTEKMTGLSEKAVRYWYDHARAQLPTHSIRLSGNVQVDEVYIGGWGGRAVLAAKDIVKKQIVFQVLPTHEVYRENILQFITDYIAPGSIVYTDSSPLYARISTLCKVTHICDNHSRFEFTLTSEIEGLFGNLRTFLRRMYHHVSDEKLEEYVREFQYRFSRKDYFTSPDQFILKTLKLVTLR